MASYLLLCFPTFVSLSECLHHSHPTSCIFPGLTFPTSLLLFFTHTYDQKAFALRGNPSYQEQQSSPWAETWHHTHRDSYLIFTSPLQAPEPMPKGTFILAVKSPRRKVIAKVLGVGPSQPINRLIKIWIWGTTPKYAYPPGPRALRGGAEYLTQHFQLLYCIWSQGGWKILSVPCPAKTWFARRAAELLFSSLLPQKTLLSYVHSSSLCLTRKDLELESFHLGLERVLSTILLARKKTQNYSKKQQWRM